MGFLDALLPRRKAAQVIDAYSPGSNSGGFLIPVNVDLSEQIIAMLAGMSPADTWRSQPHLRTVVTFIARNIAQLGLHSFERVSETDRRRLRDDPLPLLFAAPNPSMTAYELVFQLVADLALYDNAYWVLTESVDSRSGWQLRPIPPSWVVGTRGGDAFAPAVLVVRSAAVNGAQQPLYELPMDSVIHFKGWNPGDMRFGSSPLDALKQILAEQMHARAYREQVWSRGGRVGNVLTRPAGTEWSDAARERFSRDWNDKWTGDNGPKAGGTPILEDGMTLTRVGFSAREDEFIEGAKLALSEVAAVYQVNPTMVGVLDNANYSNVREFRRMLYGDSLGPTIAMIEDRINTFLVPRVTKATNAYAEFNIAEKLQGSFEEQASAMQTLVGGPVMTRGEGRARLNLPDLGGDTDQLIVPLNVLVGGQASPTDSAPLKSGRKSPLPSLKSVPTYQAPFAKAVADFMDRQAQQVLKRAGVKADGDVFGDLEAWVTELASKLFPLNVEAAKTAALAAIEALGLTPTDFNAAQTEAWLQVNANAVARAVNEVTQEQVAKALTQTDRDAALTNLFEIAKSTRAQQIGKSQATAISGFGTTEAARQNSDRATKTWVTGTNPRSAHAKLNGETVPAGDNFSNGAPWPGHHSLSEDERAGCNCDLVINPAG